MEDTSAPLPCVAREETLRDQFPDHRKIGRACRCWLSVQQLGQRVEDLAHGQLTVTGTQQRRLHGVSRAGAAQATLLTQDDGVDRKMSCRDRVWQTVEIAVDDV